MSRIIFKEGVNKIFLSRQQLKKKRMKFHWYIMIRTILPLLKRLELGVPPSPLCFSGNQELLNCSKVLCVKLRFYIHLRVLCVESWFSKAGNSFLLTLLFPWTRLPSSTKRSGDECKTFNLFMKVRVKVRVCFFFIWKYRGWMQNILFLWNLKSDAGKARASPYWRLFPWICGLCENGFSKHLNLFRDAHIGVGLEP